MYIINIIHIVVKTTLLLTSFYSIVSVLVMMKSLCAGAKALLGDFGHMPQ